MTKASRMTSMLVTAAITLMAAPAAWSAPMVRGKKSPSGDVLSLARISVIRLEIKTMPADLVALDITAEAVRKKWTQTLAAEGIRVADEDDTYETIPSLTLSVATGVDADVSPEGVLSIVLLTFRQTARFDRFDRPVAVPTYIKTLAEITLKDGLKAAMNANLRVLIENVVRDARKANAWWDNAPKAEGPSPAGTGSPKKPGTGD